MAELNNDASGETSGKKIRSKKSTSKVDLTAMVDLAFLLITFFMLTTTLNKPVAMDLTMPDSKGEPSKIDENRTMTILVGDNDKSECFMGKQLGSASRQINIGTRELRRELSSRKKEVLAYSTSKGTPGKGLIVLIKCDKKSNYGNLVDILDEMAISNVETYAIADIEPNEVAFLDKKL